MSREFPDFVDPWRLAAGNKAIGGTIPLARFKRLEPLLASTEGEADFRMSFAYDEQRRANVAIAVNAPLRLLCQRSLEPYTEQASQHSQLLVIGEEAELSNLSEHEEFVLVEEGRLAVADLVEDELLLAVPQVPRNPELDVVNESTNGDQADKTGARQEENNEGRQRPFESLAELMKDR